MAKIQHYTTPDIEVYSDDTATEAVLWVGEIVTTRIIARLFVFSEAQATTKFDDAVLIADDAQNAIDFPPGVPDWAPGKTGFASLPVV